MPVGQHLVRHATPLHRAGRYDKGGPGTCQLGQRWNRFVMAEPREALQEAAKLYRTGNSLDADVKCGLPVGQALRHHTVAYLVVSPHHGLA